ncbi:MAG: glycosyltransferase family 4 protein [Bacteroidota bacterium]
MDNRSPGINKIKLFLLTNLLDKGGVEEVILNYAKILDKKKYEITVVCFTAGTAADELSRIEGVNLVHIKTCSRVKRYFAIQSLMKTMKPDIVHNHTGWYGIPLGRMNGAKCVETIHNTYHWFNPHQRFFYGFTMSFAHRMIAVSGVVKKFALDIFPFIDEKRLAVIHNGIMIPATPQKEASIHLRKQWNIKEDDVVIGFIGRFTEQKGLEYLLKAAKQLLPEYKNVKFVIVGEGELKNRLETIVSSDNLTNVIFTGFQRDVYRFYTLFDIFLLPSLFEGLPIALLEAMAAQLPVVATRVGGTPEVVIEGKTGFLVDPANPGQIVEKLNILINDPNKRKMMGFEGRERIIAAFSAQSMVEKTEKIYRELLNR